MESHPIELRTELHQLQPLCCVPAVLLGRVTGHAGGTLIGGGPAFGALESDHNPDALVLCHVRTCTAGANFNAKDTFLPYSIRLQPLKTPAS